MFALDRDGDAEYSKYVNRGASESLKRVWLKSTEADEYDSLHSECMRTRQSLYEIAADGSDEVLQSWMTIKKRQH